MQPRAIAIVGAGLAGVTAAFTLREEGFRGRITLIGEETDVPYDRPPLSKQYLTGESDLSKLSLRADALYEENEIDVQLGQRATGVDARERAVLLTNGARITADAILITTGARNRRPAIPGLDLAGVHQLRTRTDADAIRAAVTPDRRAVIAGMGFIGCEVAASLRRLGAEVTAIEIAETPLAQVLGPEVGSVIATMHAEHGVDLVLGEGVERFEGGDYVEVVRTTSGRAIACDVVVAGFGVQPNVEIAADSGVAITDGIVVDELCRTTVPGIFAAGDVARTYHPVLAEHVRVEHWRNAMQQGAAAARSMLGKGTASEEPHWFWSDQYDTNIQYSGHHREWDEIVIRGPMDERRFVAFYLKDRVVQSAVAFNSGRDLRRARGLLAARKPVDPGALRSADVDLSSLAKV